MSMWILFVQVTTKYVTDTDRESKLKIEFVMSVKCCLSSLAIKSIS